MKGAGKMNLKKTRKVILSLFVAIFVTGMAAGILESMVFAVITLGLCVALVAVSLTFWRCPHCGEYLGRNVGQYCTHCGKKLDDLE